MKTLVALDGSDASFNALRSVCRIAEKLRSFVTALYVNKAEEYTPEAAGWITLAEKISGELEAKGETVLREAVAIGKGFGLSIDGIMAYGLPAPEIAKYAEFHGIVKLIAMGHSSKGRGTQEFVESTTKKVVAEASTPVMVTSSDTDVGSVLIAVEGPDFSETAVRFGGDIASRLGARIGLVSVIPDAEDVMSEYKRIAEVPNMEAYIKGSERTLSEMAAKAVSGADAVLGKMGMKSERIIRKGSPAAEIIAEAARYDLLVLSLHKGLGRTANKILNAHEINTVFMQ